MAQVSVLGRHAPFSSWTSALHAQLQVKETPTRVIDDNIRNKQKLWRTKPCKQCTRESAAAAVVGVVLRFHTDAGPALAVCVAALEVPAAAGLFDLASTRSGAGGAWTSARVTTRTHQNFLFMCVLEDNTVTATRARATLPGGHARSKTGVSCTKPTRNLRRLSPPVVPATVGRLSAAAACPRPCPPLCPRNLPPRV